MPVPYRISSGVNSGTTNPLNVLISSSFPVLADDIGILHAVTKDNTAFTLPAGWAVLYEQNNGASMRSIAAWKRMAGGEEGTTVGVTHGVGISTAATVTIYRGCLAGSDPIVTYGVSVNSASTTCTAPSIDLVGENSLLIGLFACSSGSTTSMSAETSDFGPMWEQHDSAGSNNVTICDVLCTPGASGTLTATLSVSAPNTGMSLELLSEPTAAMNATLGSTTTQSGYSSIGRAGGSSSSSGTKTCLLFITSQTRDGRAVYPDYVEMDVLGTPSNMTLFLQYTTATDHAVSVWYWTGSFTSGVTKTIHAYFAEPVVYTMADYAVSGIDTAQPFNQYNYALSTGTSTTPSSTLSSITTGNSVVGFVLVTGISGTSTGSITDDASQNNEDETTQQYAPTSGTTYVGGGPHRTQLSLSTKTATAPITMSWTLASSQNWLVLLLELRDDGAPAEEPPTDTPGEQVTACTLTATQHRADHLTNYAYGCQYASRLVPMGSVLAFAYAGEAETPPQTQYGGSWNAVYFRTYDPATELFSTRVVVEEAVQFSDPAGHPAGERLGSEWSYCQLLRLTDGTLLCFFSMVLGWDAAYFNPVDDTIYGGGIYVRESTDNGATWSDRHEVAPIIWGMGPAVTDGTNVWVIANKHENSISFQQFFYRGHYDAPTPDVRMHVRNSRTSWTEKTVYNAATATSDYNSYGQGINCKKDGYDFFVVPHNTNGMLLDQNTGFFIVDRYGTAATTDPLTGPGTVGADTSCTGLKMLRTTDGGTTWKETDLGVPTTALRNGNAQSVRLARMSTGRIYLTYKRISDVIGIHNVTSSGAGNRTLTQDDGTNIYPFGWGDTVDGGVIGGNSKIPDGTTAAHGDIVGPITTGTASQDLTGALVGESLTAEADPGITYTAVYSFYSDDGGVTWVDSGAPSLAVLTYNPQIGDTWEWDTDGTTTMCLSPEGRAFILGLNSSGTNAISIYKSKYAINADPTTYEYYGCFGNPVDRVFGGWGQSDSIVWTDGKIYELEQFAYIPDPPTLTSGREELWIVGYDVPTTPDIPEEPPLPVTERRMFRRGMIQFERGRERHVRRAPGSIDTWRKP